MDCLSRFDCIETDQGQSQKQRQEQRPRTEVSALNNQSAAGHGILNSLSHQVVGYILVGNIAGIHERAYSAAASCY